MKLIGGICAFAAARAGRCIRHRCRWRSTRRLRPRPEAGRDGHTRYHGRLPPAGEPRRQVLCRTSGSRPPRVTTRSRSTVRGTGRRRDPRWSTGSPTASQGPERSTTASMRSCGRRRAGASGLSGGGLGRGVSHPGDPPAPVHGLGARRPHGDRTYDTYPHDNGESTPLDYRVAVAERMTLAEARTRGLLQEHDQAAVDDVGVGGPGCCIPAGTDAVLVRQQLGHVRGSARRGEERVRRIISVYIPDALFGADARLRNARRHGREERLVARRLGRHGATPGRSRPGRPRSLAPEPPPPPSRRSSSQAASPPS